MKRLSKVGMSRLYGVGFCATLAVVSTMSFTQPVHTAKPQEQKILYSQVPTAKPGPPPIAQGVEEGKALAYIRIPRFGEHWLWTVVEGTREDDLAEGPGHFIGSALPGDRGNSVIAGHRSGHGEPFIDFEELEVGDKVVLAQNGAEWTYTLVRGPSFFNMDDPQIMQNHAFGKKLTLITCWPKYGSEKRLFVRGLLTKVEG